MNQKYFCNEPKQRIIMGKHVHIFYNRSCTFTKFWPYQELCCIPLTAHRYLIACPVPFPRLRLKSLFVMLNPSCVTGFVSLIFLTSDWLFEVPRASDWPMLTPGWWLLSPALPCQRQSGSPSVAKTGCKVDGLNCSLEGVRKYQDL